MRVDRVPCGLINPVASVAAAVVAMFMLAGCGEKAAAPKPQTPEVTTVTVQPQSVAVTTDLPGRVNSYLSADVRARVDGIVLKRDFVEGSDVKTGQRLYLIDPAPYQAALDSARATLAKAQANLVSVAAQAARY